MKTKKNTWGSRKRNPKQIDETRKRNPKQIEAYWLFERIKNNISNAFQRIMSNRKLTPVII